MDGLGLHCDGDVVYKITRENGSYYHACNRHLHAMLERRDKRSDAFPPITVEKIV
jgi:hypothetical protein